MISNFDICDYFASALNKFCFKILKNIKTYILHKGFSALFLHVAVYCFQQNSKLKNVM